MGRILIIFLTVALSACGDVPKVPESLVKISDITDEERVLRAFIEAFNAHDSDAMVALCDEEVSWVYVSGDKSAPAGRGVTQLQEEMTGYFRANPDVRSEVEQLNITGNTISVVERVTWTPGGSSEEKTQSALSVYLFEGSLIKTVWYFPTQP